MGEGVAFKFSGSDICAPVTGELILVADTLHAFGIVTHMVLKSWYILV